MARWPPRHPPRPPTGRGGPAWRRSAAGRCRCPACRPGCPLRGPGRAQPQRTRSSRRAWARRSSAPVAPVAYSAPLPARPAEPDPATPACARPGFGHPGRACRPRSWPRRSPRPARPGRAMTPPCSRRRSPPSTARRRTRCAATTTRRCRWWPATRTAPRSTSSARSSSRAPRSTRRRRRRTSQGAGWVISLTFKSEGAAIWGEYTAAATSASAAAFVLDGEVVSAPTIQSAIYGPTEISGQFNQQSAQQLAGVLRYGSLPLSFESSEAQTVSATARAGVAAGRPDRRRPRAGCWCSSTASSTTACSAC